MGVVGFLLRAQLRRRLGSLVLLAALLGVATGAVLTAWSGARRTESAYPRLLARTAGYDLTVSASGDLGAFRADDVADLPGIERFAAVHGYGSMPMLPDGTPDFERGYYLTAAADRVAYRELGAPILLDGRLPDPDRADEVIVNETALEQEAIGVGGHMDVCVFNFGAIEAFDQPAEITPAAVQAFVDEVCAVHRFTVVGVGLFLSEVVLSETNQGQAFVVGTPAFAADPGTPASYEVAAVDLAAGVDRVAFEGRVRAAADPAAVVQMESPELRAVVATRTAAPYARTLLFFAVAVAVAAAGVLGPALRRAFTIPSADGLALLAAGVRRSQLRVVAGSAGAVVGAAAAAVAVVIAAAASDRFPIGPLRAAEPSPGLRLDALVVLTGVTAAVVGAAVAGASAAVAPAAREQVAGRSPVAEWLASSGAPVPVVTGVRAALGRARSGRGALATVSGVVLAVAAVLAAFGYQAGLVRLLDEPVRYGVAWDAAYEAYEGVLPEEASRYLLDAPEVEAVSTGRRLSATVDGAAVAMFAFDDLRGTVRPVVLDGRGPVAPGEVALGGQTIDRIGAHLGDRVTIRAADRTIESTLVGRTLLPLLTLGDDVTVGEGAWVAPAFVEELGVTEPGLALVDLAPGLSSSDLHAAMVDAGVLDPESNSILGPAYTADLAAYDEIRWTPVLLASVLGLLGLGVLAHTMATTVRARRRELAVLRSIGLVRSQVVASVRWQAVALAGWCLLLAAPTGVAAGRLLWSSFADGLGVADDPVTPTTVVVLVIGGVLLAATLLAELPSRRAAAVAPALALRGE